MGGSPEKVTVQGRRGVSVGSFCQLLEAGSLKAAAPAAPTASWIPDLHTGSSWSWAERCSCCRLLCKVTSDCLPFQRQPLWKKLSPLRTQGKWGMGGNPGAFVDGKGLLGLQGRSLGSLHTLTSQVVRGHRQGVPASVQSPAGVEHEFASRPAWARARLRARRDLDGGDSFMEQRPSARASCSSASSFSSC